MLSMITEKMVPFGDRKALLRHDSLFTLVIVIAYHLLGQWPIFFQNQASGAYGVLSLARITVYILISLFCQIRNINGPLMPSYICEVISWTKVAPQMSKNFWKTKRTGPSIIVGQTFSALKSWVLCPISIKCILGCQSKSFH